MKIEFHHLAPGAVFVFDEPQQRIGRGPFLRLGNRDDGLSGMTDTKDFVTWTDVARTFRHQQVTVLFNLGNVLLLSRLTDKEFT